MPSDKKPIRSSNLALRFYKSDGWTKEEVQSFVLDTQKVDVADEGTSFEYYRFPMLANINIELLLKSYSKAYRKFDDFPDETDDSFIKRML